MAWAHRDGPQPTWPFVFGLGSLTLMPLAALPIGRDRAAATWLWVLLPIGIWLGATLSMVAVVDGGHVYFVPPDWTDLPAWSAMLLLGDTLRRRRLGGRALAVRLATASLALCLGSALAGSEWSSSSSACFPSPTSAELAAIPVEAALFHLAPPHAVLALSAFVLAWRRRWQPAVLGVACFASGLWIVDLATGAVVAETLAAPGEPALRNDVVGPWSVVADLGGGVALAMALVCWLTSVVGAWARRSRSGLVTWVALGPVVPLLLLSTSATFEPPTHTRALQQEPTPVWDEPGFLPLTRSTAEGDIPSFVTADDDIVSGLVSASGPTVWFARGRSVDDRPELPLRRPGLGHWATVELLPDARASLSSLPLDSIRAFDQMRVVWRLHDVVPPRAAARWAFVAMASRALRARTFALVEVPSACGGPEEQIEGARFLRCRLPREAVATAPYRETAEVEVLVARRLAEWRISDWLDATEGIETPIVFAVARGDRPDDRTAVVTGRSDRPDEVSVRVGSREPLLAWGIGVALGGLLALALLVLGRRPPRWLQPLAAWLGWERSPPGRGSPGAYRGTEPSSRSRGARGELASGLSRVVLALADALRSWWLVVSIAALVGLALARLG